MIMDGRTLKCGLRVGCEDASRAATSSGTDMMTWDLVEVWGFGVGWAEADGWEDLGCGGRGGRAADEWAGVEDGGEVDVDGAGGPAGGGGGGGGVGDGDGDGTGTCIEGGA